MFLKMEVDAPPGVDVEPPPAQEQVQTQEQAPPKHDATQPVAGKFVTFHELICNACVVFGCSDD